MYQNHRAAFTMLELTFVIVVIGILSAVALPRFSETSDNAYLTKAQNTVAIVRSALATERQRRILRGEAAVPITDLSLSAAGVATANAFDHFSGVGNPVVYTRVLDYPIAACSGAQRGCWVHAGTTYSYKFPDASMGVDGQADFVLAANRFDCAGADTSDCQLITQ